MLINLTTMNNLAHLVSFPYLNRIHHGFINAKAQTTELLFFFAIFQIDLNFVFFLLKLSHLFFLIKTNNDYQKRQLQCFQGCKYSMTFFINLSCYYNCYLLALLVYFVQYYNDLQVCRTIPDFGRRKTFAQITTHLLFSY